MHSIKNNKLGDQGHRALGTALLASSTSKLAFISCDKFSIGPDDSSLDLQRKNMGPADGILLSGVLKANLTITSIK